MNSESTPVETSSSSASAGRLLRDARLAQGIHIAALASAIKVSPRKLEALEADRFEQLPGPTFTRALAQTVCRSLKIDAAPVLALLPRTGPDLEQVGAGLNTPFRERPSGVAHAEWKQVVASPALWVPLFIVGAALAIYFWPSGWLASPRIREEVKPAEAPLASPAAADTLNAGATAPLSNSLPTPDVLNAVAPAPVVRTPAASAPAPTRVSAAERASLPPAAIGLPAPSASAAALRNAVQLRAGAQAWVEMSDARGRTFPGRLLQPGETVTFEGALPLRLKVGNAPNVEVSFNGQVVNLAPHTRNNLARLELK